MRVLHAYVAKTAKIPETVYREAESVKQRYDYTMKEAIRHMVREGGYDV